MNKAAVSVTGKRRYHDIEAGRRQPVSPSGAYHAGIYSNSSGSLTISGDENDSLTAQGGDSRNGIYSVSGDVTISGGTVTATGGNSTDSVGSGGRGIYSVSGDVTISGGTVNANGGDGKNGSDGGDGISSDSLTISGGTVTTEKAAGGDDGGSGVRHLAATAASPSPAVRSSCQRRQQRRYLVNGGRGISSYGGVTVSGGTVNATGGVSVLTGDRRLRA